MLAKFISSHIKLLHFLWSLITPQFWLLEVFLDDTTMTSFSIQIILGTINLK